jgi:two-component system CheB/CheR fusion protein
VTSELFLEAILGSLGVGVVVLNRELSVQVWNAASHELWGLRAEEAEGQRLSAPIRSVLASEDGIQELDVEAVTRRGKRIDCRVRVLPMTDGSDKPYGAILLTERLARD